MKYRMIGTTDDVIDCAKCGRPDLRMTVVLELLDAEGNSEGVTYYGTSCAAKVLADRGVRTSAREVRTMAQQAQQRRATQAAYGQERLDYYGIPADGEIPAAVWTAAVAKFAQGNAVALRNNPTMDPETSLRGCVDNWRSDVAAAR